jgi:hypothetical protein
MTDPYDKGLVWDKNDKFIQQTWTELKQKIQNTHGGLGIIASDFDELLRYGYGEGVQNRRDHFTMLVLEATEDEDVQLLADILSLIMRKPWETNLQGGWFIHRLRKKNNIEEFDADRAAQVLNTLYDISPHATDVLIRTLGEFIDTYENGLALLDLIEETKKLRYEVILFLNPASIFISYAREDDEMAENLRSDLQRKGFKVWKDTHDLLPGEKWEEKIRQELKECEFVIPCLSSVSVSKSGFFKEEIKIAKELQIYMIPVRFDDFDLHQLPKEIGEMHIVDLFKDRDHALTKIERSVSMNRAKKR